MAGSNKTQSARVRARQARAELEARKREQRALVERHQVSYFEADNEIRAFDQKIAALRDKIARLEHERDTATAPARERQSVAMGALVVDAKQNVSDVALLLDVTETEVKRAATAYRKRNKTPSTPQSSAEASTGDEAGAEVIA